MPENRAGADQKLNVFISYSRKDLAFAQQIVAGLHSRGLNPKIDTRDLPDLQNWRRELLDFIRASDTVIFIVSPRSVGSPVCAWEVGQVAALNKRLAPIVLERVDDDKVPEEIAKINYLFFDPPNIFEEQVDRLARALLTDVVWLKEHTRLTTLAERWHADNRPTAQLLRSEEIDAALQWAARRPLDAPLVPETVRQFLDAGRKFEQESRDRLRRRNFIITYGSLAATIVFAALCYFLFSAFQEGQRSQSHLLADLSLQQAAITQSDRDTGVLLALEALADRAANELAQRIRPYVPEAQQALDRA